MSQGRNVAPIGVHANIWSNVSTGTSTSTNYVDTWNCPFVSAFGHVGGAATITVQYSMDGVNFYDGPTQVLGSGIDFRIDCTCAARYVALKSSANVTATGTVAAKG